jgi:Transposase IS116/IS110/IS902 family
MIVPASKGMAGRPRSERVSQLALTAVGDDCFRDLGWPTPIVAKLALAAPCAHTVARLRCLRGIDTLTALGLCAEIGEWGRFDHPDQLSAYLGIVPCEHTTGNQRRLGSITKAGSTHARRLLVEASYHYRRGPVVGEPLERRQRGHAPEIINISCKAQRCLNARWRQLRDARRKPGRGRRGRDRARAGRLLLGDRDLHDHQPRTDTHTNHAHQTHQLTLTDTLTHSY